MSDSSGNTQLETIKKLLQSKAFALSFAESQQNAYQKNLGAEVTSIVAPDEAGKTEQKLVVEEKIAMNLAGLYALECGVAYLAKRDQKMISAVLQEIVEETLSRDDQELLCRFANATWKAGQPFRQLDRITRDVFVPFDLLSDEEKLKDWVQIRQAAEQVLAEI